MSDPYARIPFPNSRGNPRNNNDEDEFARLRMEAMASRAAMQGATPYATSRDPRQRAQPPAQAACARPSQSQMRELELQAHQNEDEPELCFAVLLIRCPCCGEHFPQGLRIVPEQEHMERSAEPQMAATFARELSPAMAPVHHQNRRPIGDDDDDQPVPPPQD